MFSHKRINFIVSLVVCLYFIIFAFTKNPFVQKTIPSPVQEPTAVVSHPEMFVVTNVVDGDTIDVSINNQTKRVRLIGVDTPETKDPRKPIQCFGAEASAFTTKTLLNTSVTLISDSTQDDVDKYDRLLRYVFLADGTNFNEMLVKEGYAREYTYQTPYQYQKTFQIDQTEAKEQFKGLWSKTTCNGKISLVKKQRGA